jgi:DNA-binding MarR family transcriptional regulator
LRVKEIGQRLHLDSGTLTPVLKRLEKASFVRRRRDAQDERQVRVELTDKGRETQARALDARRTIVCALGQSKPEIQALKQNVDQLLASLRIPSPDDQNPWSGHQRDREGIQVPSVLLNGTR